MSFFKKVFGGKQPEAKAKAPSCLVIVPLSGEVLPNEQDLRNRLARLETPILLGDYKFEGATGSFNLIQRIDGRESVVGFATIGLMPVGVPGGLAEVCERSWRWPEAAVRLASHPNHWVIFVVSCGPAQYETAVLSLRLVAALSATPGFLGAYFGSAGLVYSPEFLQAENEDDPATSPVNYWVHMGLFQHEDGTNSFFTYGLHEFGALEIEIPRSKIPRELLYTRGRDFAAYVMQAGPVLKHGDTVGATAEDKTRITHEPSIFNPEQTVCRINMQ